LASALLLPVAGGVSGAATVRSDLGSSLSSSTLTVALTSPPTTLDPQNSDIYADRLAWALSYQCLLTTSATGQIQPLLATGYSVGAGGLSYTFNLRHGVYFDNGELMTSADVVYTFDRLFKSGNPSLKALFPTYKSVTAVNAYTVRFNLKSPDAGFPADMASPLDYGCAILSKSSQSTNLATQMVGTGPWKQVSYTPDSSLTFTRFTEYWGATSGTANLTILYVPELTSQITDLEANRVDLIEPSAAGAKALSGTSHVAVQEVPSDVTIFLPLNSTRLPFSKVDARRALAVAIDRPELADIAYGGGAKPSDYMPPGYSWATPLSKLPYTQYNPTLAKKLLAEAGYRNGVDITIPYLINYDAGTNAFMAQLASQLGNVGFHVTLDPIEIGAFADIVYSGKFTMTWNQQSYYSNPYLYVAVPAWRAPSGGTPAALQTLENKALVAKSTAQYEQDINAISYWEANEVYPTVTVLAESSYVAYRSDLSGVSESPSNSTDFLASIRKA
jgi:ABC-type transport system substrate-binding protein